MSSRTVRRVEGKTGREGRKDKRGRERERKREIGREKERRKIGDTHRDFEEHGDDIRQDIVIEVELGAMRTAVGALSLGPARARHRQVGLGALALG